MPVSWNLAVFLGALVLVIVSSLVLGKELDRIGHRLHFSEGLIGLLTALGADAPEISSALAALLHGRPDVGVGVVVGSNVFNLAGLLGLSAVVAGHVRVSRQGLMLDGTVAMIVTVVAAAMVLGALSPVAAVALLCAVLAPYVAVSAMRPGQVARLPLPAGIHRFLDQAVVHLQQEARKDQTPPQARWPDFLSVVPALACIVIGSFWMVDAAVAVGQHWKISEAITGNLGLAVVTSLPNVVMAIRLALHGRGAAVVSETLNSNTLNLLAGLCAPALRFGSPAPSRGATLAVGWMLGATILSVILAYTRGELRRWEGSVIILTYVVFVALLVRLG